MTQTPSPTRADALALRLSGSILGRLAGITAAFPHSYARGVHGEMEQHLQRNSVLRVGTALIDEHTVQNSWQNHACGDALVGGLKEQDFPSFRVTRTHKGFMHAPPLPVHGLPGQALMGWHLWAHLEPVSSDGVGS